MTQKKKNATRLHVYLQIFKNVVDYEYNHVEFLNFLQQTSYADMLDLAVQHIKGLQNEIQVFKHSMSKNKTE